MALPHLNIYTTRRNIYEAAIVHRRNHDNDFRERWAKTANYFNTNNVEADQKAAWESKKSFNSSMEAWRMRLEKENKKSTLEHRRTKLAAMLAAERDQFKAELKGAHLGDQDRIEGMKERSEALRSAREEKRKQVAEEKLYEHWRQNNPDIRNLELEQHKQHVITGWGGQIDEKQQIADMEARMQASYEQKLENQRLAALEAEKQAAEKALEERKELQDVLRQQMKELKLREEEARRLKSQQDLLIQQQWKLEHMENHRLAVEEQRRKQEVGRLLLRQHAAVLRRKTREVMDELAADQQFLEKMIEQERADQEIQTARREKAQADAEWMKQVIIEQMKLEKAREGELDQLYQEEATRVWEQRESQWAREKEARQRLMKEVMDERQMQLAAKLESVQQRQAESLERREELIREMEIANQMTRRDQAKEEAARTERKQEIEAQISARREKVQVERLNLEEELRQEKEAEGNYEELLRQEAERLSVRGYEPKSHTRRQAWM